MKIEFKPYTPSPETQKRRAEMEAYRQAKARGEIPPPEKSDEERKPVRSLNLDLHDAFDTGGE